MARFDLYVSPNGSGYVVDIQTNLLDTLNSRVVIPLVAERLAPKPARRLNPVFDISGTSYVLLTQFLAAVPLAVLGTPVGSLKSHDREISNALDMLLLGF